MGWAAAIPIATAALGAFGGKSKSKQSKQPTRNVVLPPSQLGGWGRLQEILKSMQSAPQYRVGAGNPYLSGGMAHLMGRAGVAAPEGGYGPNPYLQPPPNPIAAPTPTTKPTKRMS